MPSPALDADAPPSRAAFLLLTFSLALAPEPVILAAEFVFLGVCVLVSALLSGAEAVLQAPLTASVAPEAITRRLQALRARPRHLLLTLQLCNLLANLGAALMAVLLVVQLSWPAHWSSVWVLVATLLGITLLLLVLGEITPRLLASRYAAVLVHRLVGVLWVLQRLFFPIADLLVRLSQQVQQRLRVSERPLSPEELKALAGLNGTAGALSEAERALLASILEFGETTVREVMVSRLDIVALPITATFGEALARIRSSGHSRLPLYAEHLDNIVGILYAKDLLPYLGQADLNQPLDWARLARPPMFVPLSKKLDDLLRDFQRRKTHMAIVVDEYGGTAGLITMEDVLEEIVGDIRDEHDEREPALYVRLDAQTYRVDARMNLDDLVELLGISLDTESFDFETLGGLILHVLGQIPKPGDEVTYGPLQLRVETVDNHRIGQVWVHVIPPEVATSPSGHKPEEEA